MRTMDNNNRSRIYTFNVLGASTTATAVVAARCADIINDVPAAEHTFSFTTSVLL